MTEGSIPLANALRDIAWLLPRTLGRAPSPARELPRSELEVMRVLVHRPGLSVNQVAAELDIQPSNVSTAVSSLVTRGQLERHPDPGDRRVVRLHPTPLAMEIRAAQECAWGDALEAILTELQPNDRELLRSATGSLAALAGALAGHADAPEAR